MYCDRSVAHDRRQGACSPINARRTGKSSRPSSRSDFRNSRHVELVRAAAHNGLVGGLSNLGPTSHTPTLNEISSCRPDTRDDARAHRSAFESLRGRRTAQTQFGALLSLASENRFPERGEGAAEDSVLQTDSGSASFRLDVRRPDHLAPLLFFIGE